MPTALGEKIRKLRKEKGFTLEKLADLTQSSKSYIWELENKNMPRPSADKIGKIAAELGVTSEFLMDSTEDSPTSTVLDSAFFRKYEKLPDIKVVRTAFFINGFAALIAIALIVWTGLREFDLYKKHEAINAMQAIRNAGRNSQRVHGSTRRSKGSGSIPRQRIASTFVSSKKFIIDSCVGSDQHNAENHAP